MKLVDTSIKKPVSVTVGVIFILLFGFISLFKIPVQLTPDVERPRVTVDTTWQGGSPSEVESEIVREQEDELKSIEGMVEMTSESQDGRGRVILEFGVGTNMDTAILKVSNKLDQVREYPEEADRPVISNVDNRSKAIAWFILKPLPRKDIDINHYHDFAENYLKPRFERVPGVASSNVFGGTEREMQVIFDPNALAVRDITLRDVATAIRTENNNYSAGSFDEGKRRYIVRTVGEYKTPGDVEDVIITRRAGVPVYVKDVARVELGYKDPDYAVRQNGDPAIAMNVIKETGANSLEVTDGILKTLDEMNSGILKQNNLHMVNVYRESHYIRGAIGLVKQNLIIGGLLAIAVLLLFLRSGSSTLVIGAAIPISIVGTFVVMAFMGRTINVISLAGMSFAVGMVIDNSIVVLENIYRHMQMGKSRVKAAYVGTVEVWGAVLASTLTTAAVFLPIIFIKEQAGQLFRDIAIAISVSVILSLIVSITVIPAAASKILQVAGSETDGKSRLNLWGYSAYAGRIGLWITAMVRRILSNKRLRISVVLSMTASAVLLSWAMMPKTEYLPTGNRNLVLGILLPPPGYNIEELVDIGTQIEADLMPYINAEVNSPESKKLAGPPIENFFYVARGRQVFMGAISKEADRTKELIPVLKQTLAKIPGMISFVTQPSLFERGLTEGRTVDIQVTGPELETLVSIAREVFSGVMKNLPDAQPQPIPSLDLGTPEVQVIIDRVRASDVGITNEELGFMVNALVDGVKVSDFKLGMDEIDLVLRGEDRFSSRTQDIENLMVNTPIGRKTTIGSLGKVVVTNGPEQINHFERNRTITVRVRPTDTMPLESAVDIINASIVDPLKQSGRLGSEYSINLRGTADKLTTTRRALQWNFILAGIIAFLLLASLFESFLYPIVIMFSVPLASFGGFLGLFVLNIFTYQPLDVLTMLGFIILIGIVVNNAILIVHQALRYIREGENDYSKAIANAVSTRIRPIFMSTTTSVCAMMPLIIFPGSGSELYRGVGSVVVGGLIVSTLFTLFLVPSVFSIVLEGRARVIAVLKGL